MGYSSVWYTTSRYGSSRIMDDKYIITLRRMAVFEKKDNKVCIITKNIVSLQKICEIYKNTIP
jgi:hypothetical protein